MSSLIAGLVYSYCYLPSVVQRSDFACLLYRKLINQLPVERITEIVTNAVGIEKKFVQDALPVELIGMNSRLMCQYIEVCADRLLIELQCPRHYNATNPSLPLGPSKLVGSPLSQFSFWHVNCKQPAQSAPPISGGGL